MIHNNNTRVIRKDYDFSDAIIRYELDDLSWVDTIELFQYLVDTGEAWTLQGHYGRVANALLDEGLIFKNVKED